jgi:hypothetical protein
VDQHDAAFGYGQTISGLTPDPEPDRSLIRLWGYVKGRPYQHGHGWCLPIEARPSSVVRPVTVALLILGNDQPPILEYVTSRKEGDAIVVIQATLASYPDGPGPVIPGLIQAQLLQVEDDADRERAMPRLSGLEPQVRLRGMILPAEEPGPDGPVPHVVRISDELRFTVRTTPFHEGNWPPLTVAVRYKGNRADHVYSRIMAPERPFVDVLGTLKAQADGSLRVQANSVLGKLAIGVAP